MMSFRLFTFVLLFTFFFSGCGIYQKGKTYILYPKESEWNLIWSEEFDDSEIDLNTWNHELLNGQQTGNNELQHYTNHPGNSFINDGKLVIKATEEEYKGHAFTSARMTTQDKFSFKYGRVEARIKIPSTKGIWPAFWMMPQESVYGGWPHSGEIDIMESVNLANETYGTIHYGTPGHTHSGGAYQPDEGIMMSDDFHVYGLEWEPNELRWYVDGELYSTKNDWMTTRAPYPAPFDQEFYLILNVAVGGNWPGSPDDSSTFPQTMEVDWIRVYQTDNKFPEVKILSPNNEAELPSNEPVKFRVEANDPDGEITQVKIVLGDQVLASTSSVPYEFDVNLEGGCYKDIVVMATDRDGVNARQSISLIIGDGCPQGPFAGTPAMIPGTIEAENFDEGRNGEAYLDKDGINQGGGYRPDSGVDISDLISGIRNIGWTEAGEWLEYEVEVAESGYYKAEAFTASAQAEAGVFSIGLANQSEVIQFNPRETGGWEDFQKLEGKGAIALEKGVHILRLEIEQGGFNLDKIILKKSD